MRDVDYVPRDIAVICDCGGLVPLVLFCVDGRPHNQASCPHCRRLCFLTPQPRVRRADPAA